MDIADIALTPRLQKQSDAAIGSLSTPFFLLKKWDITLSFEAIFSLTGSDESDEIPSDDELDVYFLFPSFVWVLPVCVKGLFLS